MRHEVIFQVFILNRWVDFCRETSPRTDLNPTNRWAKDKCDELQRAHEKGVPFRFYVEVWN